MHGVVDADDAGQRDRGVLEQRALDLERADVGAVVDDDLLLAAEEPQVAVVVGAGQVAGVEPVAVDTTSIGRRLRAFQ